MDSRRKEAEQPEALMMRVFFEHKQLAVVLLSAVKAGAHPDDKEHLVASVMISHTAKPWQVALLEKFLPEEGRLIEWLDMGGENVVESRLENVWRETLKRYSHEISFAESSRAWGVALDGLHMDVRNESYVAGAYYEDGKVRGLNERQSDSDID